MPQRGNSNQRGRFSLTCCKCGRTFSSNNAISPATCTACLDRARVSQARSVAVRARRLRVALANRVARLMRRLQNSTLGQWMLYLGLILLFVGLVLVLLAIFKMPSAEAVMLEKKSFNKIQTRHHRCDYMAVDGWNFKYYLLVAFHCIGSAIKTSTDSPHIIPSSKTPAIRSDFCITKGCTQAANVYINSIDPTVNPCVDFYDFACGGYAKNHHLPLNVESIMVGSDVEKSFMARMIDYLSHDSLDSKPNIADREAAKLFRLCMDIDKQEIQPFLPLIQEVGGPPFSNGVRPGWEELIELLGFEQFPIWSTTFYLDNDMLIAPRFMSKRNDKAFVRKLIRMVTADMNMVWNETFVNSHLTDYINLLNEIEKISNNYIDVSINATGSSYFPLTIDEAVQRFPEFPWKSISKHRISPITRVFAHWNYVRDVYKLWQNSTLNNLMKDWYLLNFLEASLMQFGFEYSKLYEARYGSPRDAITFCRKTVEDSMPRWVDVFFWENVAKPQDYNSLNKFVATLREAWLENMRENDWIEPETKRNITERVAKIAFKYGFKVPLYTRKELADLYAQIELTMPQWVDVFFWENVAKPQDYKDIEKFVANIREAWLENMRENDWIEPETKQKITEQMAKISFKYGFEVPLYTRKELDDLYAQYVHIDSPSFFEYTQAAETFVVKGTFPDYSWKHALTEFAYYQPSIETPYVFLGTRLIVEPYFASDYPPELNYGSIGFIAAHEVTHGFDPNVLNRSLLVGDDEQQFDERVECIVDQFGNITVSTQSPGSVDHLNQG